jgi:hypothetical protein
VDVTSMGGTSGWASAGSASSQSAPRWSEQAVLEAIASFRREHGRDPRRAKFARSDERYPTPSAVWRYCGGWRRALAAAPSPSGSG